ncbi:MAG: hypothetical protein FWF45_06505 [Coriobacteriia bacterium]|nr:hypothetical protein [Coriobacteriia bacterium]
MSDASGVAASTPQSAGKTGGEPHAMSPFMKVLIVIAAVVVVLALVIMFVFTSHQSALQNEANREAAAQQQQNAGSQSLTNTEGTVGPIKVIDTPLYNRENAAFGKTGNGPESVITNAEVDVPPLNSTDNN